MVQLGQAITAQRTGLKLRIVDVAEALSLSKQTLIKIEKGDAKVNFNNLLNVMEYLGLSFQIIADEGLAKTSLSTQPIDSESDDAWF